MLIGKAIKAKVKLFKQRDIYACSCFCEVNFNFYLIRLFQNKGTIQKLVLH